MVAASTSNVASTATAGIAGIVIARSLGPSVRGEYAAIMIWFGLMVVFGGLGQSAAVTFFVAREPGQARDYVAASRALMVATGVATLAIGMLAAPWLGAGDDTVVWGYRLMFASCLVAYLGVSYTFALQGSNIGRWTLARISQPAGYLVAIVALHATGRLTLMTALAAFSATLVAQLALAYVLCARGGLTGGRPSLALARPLSRYGMGQLAAMVPVVVVARLDQLTLTFTVDPAVLGNYAVAVSLTSLAVPIVAGLGNVAFPRVAAQRGSGSASARLQRQAVIVSAGIALTVMIPLAALAPWLVPAVFGEGFRDAVVLVVLLAPRGVLLASQQVCADLLRGHGQPLAVARAHGVAAGLMVVLILALMPTLGAPGAALASSVSAGVSLLLLLRALNRVLRHDNRSSHGRDRTAGETVL